MVGRPKCGKRKELLLSWLGRASGTGSFISIDDVTDDVAAE